MVKYPEDWKVVPLGDVAAITRGGSPRPIQAWLTDSSDGLNWIKIGDVSVGAKYITSTEERIIPLGARYSREVKSGDFILSNSMSFGRPYILKIDGCIHDGWLAIQEYSKSYDTEYLYYILSSEDVFSQYVAMAAGSSVKNLNKDKVSDVKIPLPPLPEQKRIAAVLGNVDKLIDNLSRQLEKKRLVKQGVMQDLLTGKKRLPGFTGEWVEKKIAKCAMVKARIGWQGLTTAEYLIDGLYYLVNGTNIENGRVNWNTCYYVNENRYQQDKYIQLKIGDVLVSKDGTIGKVAYVDKMSRPATLNSGVFVIRSVDESLNQEYLARVFLSKWFAGFIDKITAGSTIVHLYQKDIVNFEFPIPPTLAEQNAIAKVLGDMDVEIAKLEAKCKKYRHLKQGLMNDLLTGKVRILGKEKLYGESWNGNRGA